MSENNNPLVFVVEDSASSGALYTSYLQKSGYDVVHYLDGHSALVGIKEKMPEVIVQDVCLPDISGLDVLKFVNGQSSPARVIMITSNSSIDIAVEAMRLGGFDFIEKPFPSERLINSVAEAIKQSNEGSDEPTTEAESVVSKHFVGESLSMKTVFRLLESAARSRASVFVTGESGTGKEVCAMTLHEASSRRDAPFIAINCAAIPPDLFESEFFGHVKGAFSGALTDRIGAVEAANGGTLFLDEICEMELNLQAKLLRFLQTGTFTRVGSSGLMRSDVRVVCATNRNPSEEVGEGRFREDLFYRLNVIPVQLPALRDREDDILLLAKHVLKTKSKENDKSFVDFSDDVKNLFKNYDWPGNIREMQNTIENMVVVNEGKILDGTMLPDGFAHRSVKTTRFRPDQVKSPPQPSLVSEKIQPLWLVEKQAIENAISNCDGNIPLAAAYLGISASTIYRKIKSWD